MLTIRKITPEDSRNEISNIYEQSWRAAYAGIVPQDYLDSIPSGRWASKGDVRFSSLETFEGRYKGNFHGFWLDH